MKTLSLSRLLIAACFAAHAGWTVATPTNGAAPANAPLTTNYVMVLVTNWYAPQPNLRTINGQIYNPTSAQTWQSVEIPEGASALGARYYGSVQPIDLTFTWGSVERRDRQTVVINNFPYDPADFRHVHREPGDPDGDIVTGHALFPRVYPVDIQTNWSPLGRMWIGQRTYDYGLPYTNRVPIVSWQRVPAFEVPKAPPPVTALARPRTVLPLRTYMDGNLSNRLAAIQSVTPVPKRDELLLSLSADAARQGDTETVKQSVGQIANLTLRDSAAQMAAMTLSQNGKIDDAYVVAGMITSAQRRKFALELLRRQNQ